MASDESFSNRAWLAYHSLPRGPNGKPPPQSQLEERHELNKATLYKVFNGGGVHSQTLPKIAKALEVSQEWLTTGVGKEPTPTGHVPPRPGTPEALVPPSLVGNPSKAKRRGDLPGWPEAEQSARQKEERYHWAIRGAREVLMEEIPQPGKLTADYVLAIAALVRAHVTRDEAARLEELEINEEKTKTSRKMARVSHGRRA